jgi:hypothetical protein
MPVTTRSIYGHFLTRADSHAAAVIERALGDDGATMALPEVRADGSPGAWVTSLRPPMIRPSLWSPSSHWRSTRYAANSGPRPLIETTRVRVGCEPREYPRASWLSQAPNTEKSALLRHTVLGRGVNPPFNSLTRKCRRGSSPLPGTRSRAPTRRRGRAVRPSGV